MQFSVLIPLALSCLTLASTSDTSSRTNITHPSSTTVNVDSLFPLRVIIGEDKDGRWKYCKDGTITVDGDYWACATQPPTTCAVGSSQPTSTAQTIHCESACGTYLAQAAKTESTLTALFCASTATLETLFALVYPTGTSRPISAPSSANTSTIEGPKRE
ncbi:hypothetical protein PWT90_06984 [Aphanocladium album]|nr:hypothetical protein PWT90_06984 [Aphanocladium album]